MPSTKQTEKLIHVADVRESDGILPYEYEHGTDTFSVLSRIKDIPYHSKFPIPEFLIPKHWMAL